jgi:uncharacterized protein (TIGR02118 family)
VIKLVFAVHRLPSFSRAEFQRHWREVHAPLVQRHAAALRIRRYVQVHALDAPLNQALRASRGGPEGYDGVAELWWESLDELAAALREPAAQAAGAALLEDERRFIDLARSPLWLGEEHVVVGGSAQIRA